MLERASFIVIFFLFIRLKPYTYKTADNAAAAVTKHTLRTVINKHLRHRRFSWNGCNFPIEDRNKLVIARLHFNRIAGLCVVIIRAILSCRCGIWRDKLMGAIMQGEKNNVEIIQLETREISQTPLDVAHCVRHPCNWHLIRLTYILQSSL